MRFELARFAEPRPARQASNAEALVAVTEAALAQPAGSRTGGERYQVVVHVDQHVLHEDGEGTCALDDGSALAAETARRLACDASLVRNARKTRTIPASLRRALRTRDGGCRFPGCENRRCDAHHVRHLGQGRRDDAPQPRAALQTTSPRCPRGRLQRRRGRPLLLSLGRRGLACPVAAARLDLAATVDWLLRHRDARENASR